MIIPNCPVTQSDAVVSKEFSQIHTGVDIEANTVYSASQGVVLYCGKDQTGKYTVTVSVLNSNCCFNYKNLSSCAVVSGENIEQGRVIGTCFKYVHVEFCNKDENVFPLRVGSETYYKQDPTSALSGTYQSTVSYMQDILYLQKTQYSSVGDTSKGIS